MIRSNHSNLSHQLFMTAGPPSAKSPGSATFPLSAPAGRGRVLIVEDNYFAALTIENALVDAGYDVLAVVDSGEDALTFAAQSRPDLVLMDIRLAGELDGIETAISLHGQGIVSLFASAHFDDSMLARGAAAQPAAWLVKPFSDAEIVAAVRGALQGIRGD